tara:strand:+ start:1114 stop:1383 length:270 start_codon:yes stop_codon:yes gene_type:complete
MATFTPSIDTLYTQTAVHSVLRDYIDEATAQQVLDKFIDTSKISANVGCNKDELVTAIHSGLVKQIEEQATQISEYILENYHGIKAVSQ